MKHVVLSFLAFSTVFSTTSFGKPIEDGSSFTGHFVAQEQACEKEEFSYVTGQTILVPDYNFSGTPEGLVVDGNLRFVQELRMNDHGGGFQTGAYARYESSDEFVAGTVIIGDGKKTVTEEDYKLVTPDELIKTTTTTINEGQSQASVCHFLR